MGSENRRVLQRRTECGRHRGRSAFDRQARRGGIAEEERIEGDAAMTGDSELHTKSHRGEITARASLRFFSWISAIYLLLLTPAANCAEKALTEHAIRNTSSSPLPSLEEAMASTNDAWGELAMKQPNGASYEFFEKLLPPLRYVNADFLYYPIVLSAPNAKVKARLISNGCGINVRGGTRAWNDNGTAVKFRVGPDEFLFGGLRERVSAPTLAEGWLPIAAIPYRHSTPLQQGGHVPMAAPKPNIDRKSTR